MTSTQLDIPAGALETLDDGIGFVALVDRMQTDHALKVVNSAFYGLPAQIASVNRAIVFREL